MNMENNEINILIDEIFNTAQKNYETEMERKRFIKKQIKKNLIKCIDKSLNETMNNPVFIKALDKIHNISIRINFVTKRENK